MPNRRTFVISALGATSAATVPWSRAQGQLFPSRPVTVVVGYPAGGPTDIFARAISERLSQEWKQPVVVENRPGANEIVAAQHVSRAPADGLTLYVSTEAPLTLNPFLFKKLPYDPLKSFAPITQLLSCPMVLVTNPNLRVNSLREFIALAKSRANTQPITYGSAGDGNVNQLCMAMLAKQESLTLTHVPYKGVAPALNDLLAGQIDSGWIGLSAVAPYVKEGRLKALVVGASKRVPALNDIPAFTRAETGISPVRADFIFAMLAPAGTPLGTREFIAASVARVMDDPAFRARNVDPFGYVVANGTPAQLEQYLKTDMVEQGERMKAARVEPT